MRQDWWSCDGAGHTGSGSAFDGPRTNLASRRTVLLTAAMGLAAWAGRQSSLANVTLHADKGNRNILVFLFLRGGADGLNMVVPHGDHDYYKARPSLAIPSKKVTDLNGYFGLHPALAPFADLYHSGQMGIVHACGSNDQTRSHFQAMNTVERGAPQDHIGPVNGWLARHLLSKAGSDSPLRAVSFSETMPDSLKGATQALSMLSLDEFSLKGGSAFEAGLSSLYGGKDLVQHSGQQTLSALKSLRSLDPKSYKASHGAVYPKTPLGDAFQQTACLVRADLGLEIACLDRGGWDTHVTQGADTGWLSDQLSDVSGALSAFCTDMGSEMKRVTVVVMSEFGRRVEENAGLGTDHGRGGAVFLVGGGVKGGKVYSQWPGLKPSDLDEVGDLQVTTDYRTVLAEVLTRRMSGNVAEVFPGLAPGYLGLIKA